VVGVMTTFASIAAAGDVNVNTIAPGIAAAITATVSGLLIAIPALFAYNILMSRIREKMNSLEIYGEDLLSRMAFNASMEKIYAA
jgi:biopolymer transport protein ExbB